MTFAFVELATHGPSTLAAGLFEGVLPEKTAGMVVLAVMGLLVLFGLIAVLSLRAANKNLKEQLKKQDETREAVKMVAKICEHTYKNQRDVSEGLMMLNRMVQKKGSSSSSSTPSPEPAEQ
ncbi:MAG: hypothetical protein R3236_08280, partial [Phycisphaeraceae bacterium]|nr:hypothetical protein [Phycisphaeraceae bacterium]